MLIIEGTDHVGKTTLAKKLERRFSAHGFVYQHLSRLTDGFDRYWGYLPLIRPRVVQDRLFLSEIAYASARGESSEATLPPEYLRLLNAHKHLVGGFTVLITCNDYLLTSRYAKEENQEHQMYKTPIVIAANKAFMCLPAQLIEPGYHIHLTKDRPWPSEDQLEEIVQEYTRLQNILGGLASRNPSLRKLTL